MNLNDSQHGHTKRCYTRRDEILSLSKNQQGRRSKVDCCSERNEGIARVPREVAKPFVMKRRVQLVRQRHSRLSKNRSNYSSLTRTHVSRIILSNDTSTCLAWADTIRRRGRAEQERSPYSVTMSLSLGLVLTV